MKVVAVLAIRNEARYLGNCLAYLAANGVSFAVIDNGSEDGSAEIATSARFRPHLVHFETLPYEGFYDWRRLLEAKRRLYRSLDADWVIHHDADEIMHSNQPGETLAEGIRRIHDTGAQAINFDEFVFLPVRHDYVIDQDGHQPLRHYYFFEPKKERLVRAWQAALDVSAVETGGHRLEGEPFVLAEETMALRHYIFQSAAHASTKYVDRTYSKAELARGWHGNRIGYTAADFAFPSTCWLHKLRSADDRDLDRSRPVTKHYWQWPRPGLSLRRLIGG